MSRQESFEISANVSSDGKALLADGKSFQALAALTGKARSPIVERRVDGTTSDTVLADRRSVTTTVDIGRTAYRLSTTYDSAVHSDQAFIMSEHTAGVGFSPEVKFTKFHTSEDSNRSTVADSFVSPMWLQSVSAPCELPLGATT